MAHVDSFSPSQKCFCSSSALFHAPELRWRDWRVAWRKLWPARAWRWTPVTATPATPQPWQPRDSHVTATGAEMLAAVGMGLAGGLPSHRLGKIRTSSCWELGHWASNDETILEGRLTHCSKDEKTLKICVNIPKKNKTMDNHAANNDHHSICEVVETRSLQPHNHMPLSLKSS